jgi:chromosome segregation ATPase
MKNRLGIVILVVVCLALGIALISVHRSASAQRDVDLANIQDYSNKLSSTSTLLEEQKQVVADLYKDRDEQKKTLTELSNNLTQVSANLSEKTETLAKTEATLKSAQEEGARKDTRITELENQNQALDKQALELTNAITSLSTQIGETQRKLAASEGDKAFLEKELSRLIAEKAELERQFNDLAVLRAQVAKLKQDLNIARRIEWIRMGLFASEEQKGAQKLMQGAAAPQYQAKASKPAYDLNVEISADGSVKVVPPPGSSPGTNVSSATK